MCLCVRAEKVQGMEFSPLGKDLTLIFAKLAMVNEGKGPVHSFLTYKPCMAWPLSTPQPSHSLLSPDFLQAALLGFF